MSVQLNAASLPPPHTHIPSPQTRTPALMSAVPSLPAPSGSAKFQEGLKVSAGVARMVGGMAASRLPGASLFSSAFGGGSLARRMRRAKSKGGGATSFS